MNLKPLALILVIFISLATAHSLIVPITQGEDELAHYRYIAFIAQTGRLPINQAEREQAWYRADWPPLYHLLVGWTVSGLDTTKPHLKDVGEAAKRRLVGEIFYPRLIIYTEDANWPWQDGILAWHIGRFMSVAFASLALIFIYLTAYELISQSTLPPSFPFITTALLAFTPRFIFTSAMLGDDSLFILLSALFIWLLLRLARGHDSLWLYAVSGLIIGSSIVTKYSTGLLPFAILLIVWWRKRQTHGSWRWAISRVVINWLCTIIGTSWWFGWIMYYFNTVKQDGWLIGLLYPLLGSGPDVSMNRIFALLRGETFKGQARPDAIAPGTFSGWLNYLFETFWGVPILEHDPFYPYLSLLMIIICGLACVGLWQLWRKAETQTRLNMALLLTIVGLLLPFPILRFLLTRNILETGQGRHILYPAAQAIPILLMWGLFAMRSKKWEFRNEKLEMRNNFTPYFLLLTPALLLTFSITQLSLMATTYPAPLPIQTTTFNEATIPLPLKHDFGEAIRLLGYDLKPLPHSVELTLFWQARQAVQENYRTQITFIDPQKQVVSTWISHPINGLYPTRAWDKGDIIRDTLHIPLVTLTAPTALTVQLTLIHEADFEPITPQPLALTSLDWVGQAHVTANQLWITRQPVRYRQTIALTKSDPNLTLTGPDNQPRPPLLASGNLALFMVGANWPSGEYQAADLRFTVANDIRLFELPEINSYLWIPVEANFANQVKLLGYTLPNRRAEAGGGLPITLYWQSLAPVLGDYRVFDKLLDDKQIVYGGYDRLPREYYSTILWAEHEIVEDGFGIPISADAPNGVYNLHIGLYSLETGAPVSLPLMENGQASDVSSVVIGPIKVGGAPASVIMSNPQPATMLNQRFGEAMTLLGYDLTTTPDISLTLYWQAHDRPAADYTTFVHLRDENNQNVTSMDSPPANGRYPTSLWDKGDTVAQQVTLSLDDVKSGHYRLVIGLYDSKNGNRLSVDNSANNELLLDEVTRP